MSARDPYREKCVAGQSVTPSPPPPAPRLLSSLECTAVVEGAVHIERARAAAAEELVVPSASGPCMRASALSYTAKEELLGERENERGIMNNIFYFCTVVWR